jgi:hypothetical protein
LRLEAFRMFRNPGTGVRFILHSKCGGRMYRRNTMAAASMGPMAVP